MSRSRNLSDEQYVIDLCDEILEEKGKRQHRFDFLRGDPGKRGRSIRLPVDAFYESRKLVVEYMERQHAESVPFFDRRLTVSGISRGEQRKRYDERRIAILPGQGIQLVTIFSGQLACSSGGRLKRRHESDMIVITELLNTGLQ